jgi:hypothetical protein
VTAFFSAFCWSKSLDNFHYPSWGKGRLIPVRRPPSPFPFPWHLSHSRYISDWPFLSSPAVKQLYSVTWNILSYRQYEEIFTFRKVWA